LGDLKEESKIEKITARNQALQKENAKEILNKKKEQRLTKARN
jgi:hypothetical protein